jgi:lysophospholipid acyltransferase (LPLAT)-like uncharacterized protein
MAQKSRCPIIPVGAAAWPCKQLASWDRFLLPYPFSRAAVTFGEPLWVPPHADEALIGRLAQKLEDLIHDEIARAEALVRGER